MLKKIVKYGNSSALVLDKALLELLNMEEGSVVKIKTDGVSLIITPQHALVQETISPTLTIEGTFNDAVKNCLAQSFGGDSEKAALFQEELREIGDRYRKSVEEKKDNPELQASALERMKQEMDALFKKYLSANSQDLINGDVLKKEFEGIHKKYQHVLTAVSGLMETPEYIHEMALLGEKHQNTTDAVHSNEYLKASAQLISKSIPEYATYQDELKKVGEKWNQKIEKKRRTNNS